MLGEHWLPRNVGGEFFFAKRSTLCTYEASLSRGLCLQTKGKHNGLGGFHFLPVFSVCFCCFVFFLVCVCVCVCPFFCVFFFFSPASQGKPEGFVIPGAQLLSYWAIATSHKFPRSRCKHDLHKVIPKPLNMAVAQLFVPNCHLRHLCKWNQRLKPA